MISLVEIQTLVIRWMKEERDIPHYDLRQQFWEAL